MTRARAELISLLALLGAVACCGDDDRECAPCGDGGEGTGGSEQEGGTSEGGGAGMATPTATGTAGIPEGTAGAPDLAGGGTSGQAGSPSTTPEATAGAGGAPAEPPCETSADCPDEQVCAEYRIDDNFYCTDPLEDAAAIGEECDTDLVSDECSSRLCLDFDNRCSELCTQDSDCDTEDSSLCVNFGDFSFCAAGCATTADCPEDQVCRIATNADRTDYHWACGTSAGSIEAGQPPEGDDCQDDNDCVNGLCLSANAADDTISYFCTEPCETEADCPDGLATCDEVDMALPGSGTTPVLACTP